MELAVVDMAARFAAVSTALSSRFCGPYHPGAVLSETAPITDDGGSIVAPGTPIERSCQVQIDPADEKIRSQDGYVDRDVKFLILAASLDGGMDTDATVRVDAGPGAGTWSVMQIERDTFGALYIGRGRQV